MNTRIHVAPRSARRAGVIFSLVAVAALLGGCSSGASSSADTKAVAAVDAGGDAAYANADAPQAASEVAAEPSMVITGAMYMTVEDPIAAADKAAGIVTTAGGRIDARNETAPDERYGGSAVLTLRIPSIKLDAVIDDLRALGTVDQLTSDSYNVSNEVTDLDAQISTLRASTARIEGLMADAKNISDIITLENELDGRQAELQSLEARQRGLDDQVSMATIDLSLTTEPVVVVNDDGPKNFWDGLVSGWNGLFAFVSVALVIFGVLLPWLALMALIAAAIVIPLRATKSRRARRAPAWNVAPAQSVAPAQPVSAAQSVAPEAAGATDATEPPSNET